jgi:hypothetical protein
MKYVDFGTVPRYRTKNPCEYCEDYCRFAAAAVAAVAAITTIFLKISINSNVDLKSQVFNT